ncbi:hypothetical protein NPIL_406711 [Nephila pilipes]|uniref:Uncharacterized protein n=1 Tax=Nephila pilipes TaxID=299642 RepID=A0A8X6MVC3_NEPPI|nr:hypothetical protein NPIL_406711 [Nephila pilipes]
MSFSSALTSSSTVFKFLKEGGRLPLMQILQSQTLKQRIPSTLVVYPLRCDLSFPNANLTRKRTRSVAKRKAAHVENIKCSKQVNLTADTALSDARLYNCIPPSIKSPKVHP